MSELDRRLAAPRPGPLRMAPDRRARDRRIRELLAEGWSLSAIAAEVGISDERVRQIRDTSSPEELVADRRAVLAAELDELLRHAEVNRRRIRTVRRTLDRIDEEREAQAIDRLLGLG